MKNISNIGTGPQQRNGFTIIEIIAVLLLIGIITVISASWLTSSSVYSVVSEAEALKANLRYAQLRAMGDADTNIGANGVTWGIAFAAGSYTLQKNGNTASTNLPNESSPVHNLPSGIAITTGAGTSVTYDTWGSPGAANIAVVVSDGASPRTIAITRNTGFIP